MSLHSNARQNRPSGRRFDTGNNGTEHRLRGLGIAKEVDTGAYGPLPRAAGDRSSRRAAQSTTSPHELPLPDEGRNVRTHGAAMRVRDPPTRARPRFTGCGAASTSSPPLVRTARPARADGRGLSVKAEAQEFEPPARRRHDQTVSCAGRRRRVIDLSRSRSPDRLGNPGRNPSSAHPQGPPGTLRGSRARVAHAPRPIGITAGMRRAGTRMNAETAR